MLEYFTYGVAKGAWHRVKAHKKVRLKPNIDTLIIKIKNINLIIQGKVFVADVSQSFDGCSFLPS